MNDESKNLESSENFLSVLEEAIISVIQKNKNEGENKASSSLRDIVKTIIWFIDRETSRELFDLIRKIVNTTNNEEFYDMLIRHISSPTNLELDNNSYLHKQRAEIIELIIENLNGNLDSGKNGLIETIAELAESNQIHMDFRKLFIKYIAKSLTYPSISEQTSANILMVIRSLVSDKKLSISKIIHSQWFEGEKIIQKLNDVCIEILRRLIMGKNTTRQYRGKIIETICYLFLYPPQAKGEGFYEIEVPFISRIERRNLLKIIKELETKKNIIEETPSEQIELLNWLNKNSHIFNSDEQENYIYNNEKVFIKQFKNVLQSSKTPALVHECLIKVIKQYPNDSNGLSNYSMIFIDALQNLILDTDEDDILDKLMWVSVHLVSVNYKYELPLVNFFESVLRNPEKFERLLDIFQYSISKYKMPKFYRSKESRIIKSMFMDFDISETPKPVLKKIFDVIKSVVADSKAPESSINLLISGSFNLYYNNQNLDVKISKYVIQNLIEITKVSFKSLKKTQPPYETLLKLINLQFGNEEDKDLRYELIKVIMSLLKCPEMDCNVKDDLISLIVNVFYDSSRDNESLIYKKLLEAIKSLRYDPEVHENIKMAFYNALYPQQGTWHFLPETRKELEEVFKDYFSNIQNNNIF